jgi:hypothetical protein
LISLRMGLRWVMAWVEVGETVTCQLIPREVGMILKSSMWPSYVQRTRFSRLKALALLVWCLWRLVRPSSCLSS